MSVKAIIQARMGSTRLPGKVMMLAAGKPLLAHVIERVKACPRIDDLVVATTNLPEDHKILTWCQDNNVKAWGWTRKLSDGNNDVLARFATAAQLVDADHYVRVTGDCALWCPLLGGEVISEHLRSGLNYSSNVHPLVDGFDTEVFSKKLLMITEERATNLYHRQHVTPYMRLNVICGYLDHSHLVKNANLSVDTEGDFHRIKMILESVKDFTWQETMRCAMEAQINVREI